jgi:uroporphyrinogen decarboxylase
VLAEPDFDNVLAVLRRERPARPTLFEFFMNDDLYQRVTSAPRGAAAAQVRINAFRAAGYDYAIHWGSDFEFQSGTRASVHTHSLDEGVVITDRAGFEAYDWPDPDSSDYSPLESEARLLPDGMKFIVAGSGGVLENAISLMGYSNLCLMLTDDPEMVREVIDCVGSRLLRHYELALAYDSVGAIISNDDWGFKTQPMLSPAQLRRYVFPWHERIVAAAHSAGKPAILHSCGNLACVMDDIIDVMKFDGKHSFEDTIMPVEDAYENYGRRIAIMGGIDMDFLCRSTRDAIHERSKAMIKRSAERGSYALGTGNSVPEYVPIENYFAMIAAATENRRG